jgi:transposase
LALSVPQQYQRINLYFEDESRFGLHTKYGRGLAAKGVQPVCTFQQVFQYTYLFGSFSPVTGDRFLLEMPCCNADIFQQYLNLFSEYNKEEYKIIVLDNGAFHKAKKLIIPDNIALLFLPPYSPELNPAEKLWQQIKRKFTNKHFDSLNQISDFFTQALNHITSTNIINTCAYKYIFANSSWSI